MIYNIFLKYFLFKNIFSDFYFIFNISIYKKNTKKYIKLKNRNHNTLKHIF